MDFRKTLDQVRNDEISTAEVVNDILFKTQQEPDRINLFIVEIDLYLFGNEFDLSPLLAFLHKVFNEKLTFENTKISELMSWQRLTINVCNAWGFESMSDLYKSSSESTKLSENPLFVVFCHIFKEIEKKVEGCYDYRKSSSDRLDLVGIYYLKNSLKKYIEPNKELPPPPNKTPFKDDQTKGLFEYIVEHWDNDKATKWGYIWEYLFTKENGRLTNKTDYEAYLRVNYNFTKGKPNYESCNSENRYSQLEELKKRFSVNLDLN
jgi:hypothetical protein